MIVSTDLMKEHKLDKAHRESTGTALGHSGDSGVCLLQPTKVLRERVEDDPHRKLPGYFINFVTLPTVVNWLFVR